MIKDHVLGDSQTLARFAHTSHIMVLQLVFGSVRNLVKILVKPRPRDSFESALDRLSAPDL